MNKETWIGLLVTVAVVVAGGVAWYQHQQQEPAPAPAELASAPPPATPVPDNTRPEFPLPTPAAAPTTEKPLPAMDDSDGPLRDELSGVFGQASVDSFLAPTELIKRIVAAIDNLDRDALPMRLRPVPGTAGQLLTQGSGPELSLADSNSQRYAPFAAAVQAADMQALAALYFHYYPLFQKAYEDLGYPKRYFNDRLVKAIDNLLAAPVPEGPIKLVQPKVFYEYADPDLEARSYGQKMMMRLGPQNELAIKVKLRQLRAAIVARKP